jgi:hypothetical protein
MVKRRFKASLQSGISFDETPAGLWLADAHSILDEMYGPHPKICSFMLVESQQIVHTAPLLKDVYGYEEPHGTPRSFRALLNNWYAYYRLSYRKENEYMHEMSYKFANDNDAVWFALRVG